MKPPSVFDKSFRYVPSIETDVKKTIERARKRIQLAQETQAKVVTQLPRKSNGSR